MSSKTKLSMTKAAELAGIERSTLYRHIEEKGISVIREEGSHPKIDVSELIRVYGDKVKIEDLSNKSTTKKVSDDTENEDLQQKDTNLVEKLNLLETERKRERDQYEEQIDHLKTMLEQEQAERRKVTALLTDQSSKSGDADKWEKLIEKQQEVFANQLKEISDKNEKTTQDAIKKALEEQARKQEEERERRRQAIKKQREELARKKAEEEKNKGFFQKLFGS